MSAQSPTGWLTKLRATDLHRLAVSIGTPCSGTKPVRIQGIHKALSLSTNDGDHTASADKGGGASLSLLSIDMGIRNLAFSHWTASGHIAGPHQILQYSRPTLNAWQKIDISSSSAARREISQLGDVRGRPADADDLVSDSAGEKESFEPINYADRAYTLVRHLLDSYRPSHILIERQRFRSGGRAAVQEWTIRVGVFEGMLYAALRGFADVHRHEYRFSVEPVLPARVNRYWFRDDAASVKDQESSPAKLTAREVKKAKINLVLELLLATTEQSNDALFETHANTAAVVQRFVGKAGGTGKLGGKRNKTKVALDEHAISDMSKLDDLADCLLQGLAWTQWQNNRLRLRALQQDALDLYE